MGEGCELVTSNTQIVATAILWAEDDGYRWQNGSQ